MVEVHVTLRGEPDPKTHYVLDIKKFALNFGGLISSIYQLLLVTRKIELI